MLSDGEQVLVPFANFGTVTFTDADATPNDGTVDTTGAVNLSLIHTARTS